MKAPALSPHRHRFARAETWAKLWLDWLGRYLAGAFGFLPPLPRAIERECQLWLDQVANLVAWLLVARACATLEGQRVHAMRRRPGVPSAIIGQGARLHTPLRVILGGEMRRAFNHGGIGGRIQFLYRVLADMDGFAAQLANRMRDGYTRLTPILGAPILGAPASSPTALVQSACAARPHAMLALDTS